MELSGLKSFTGIFPKNGTGTQGADKSEGGKNFADFLKDSFYEANNLKIQSDNTTNDFLAGKTDNLHEVMIAAQKAEVAISFVTEVRNRIVEAYQEFSRMQL